MFAATTIAEEILDLKKQRKAILLAHHYQEPEIQELADVIGDSLELSRKARDFEGDVIAFCGVWFMAETAKVLNPDRIVVVPDREAGCSLVESCPVEPVREFRAQHPDHVDGQLHQHVDRSEGGERHPVHVAQCREDRELDSARKSRCCSCPTSISGNYVKKQTGRENMKIWQGACIVHATFPARRVAEAKLEHPDAKVVAHPECPESVLAMADFIGSTSAIIEWCGKSDADEFIVMTESGVNYSLDARGAGQAVLLRGQRELQLLASART